MFAALPYMGYLQTACTDGKNGVGSARTCVNSMAAGSLRTTCQNGLEDLGGALTSPFSTANQGKVASS